MKYAKKVARMMGEMGNVIDHGWMRYFSMTVVIKQLGEGEGGYLQRAPQFLDPSLEGILVRDSSFFVVLQNPVSRERGGCLFPLLRKFQAFGFSLTLLLLKGCQGKKRTHRTQTGKCENPRCNQKPRMILSLKYPSGLPAINHQPPTTVVPNLNQP
jgi:hypothetical protein